MATFTKLPPELRQEYDALERRRQLRDAMMNRPMMTGQPTRYVPGRYGRAVPTTGMAGGADLGKSIINLIQGRREATKRKELAQKAQSQEQAVIESMMQKRSGSPGWQQSGPMQPGAQRPVVGAERPDPMTAALEGIASPYAGPQRVANAMMDMQATSRGRGEYVTDGELWDDETKRMVPVLFNRRVPQGHPLSVTHLDGSPVPARLLSGKGPQASGAVASAKEGGKIRGGDVAQADIDLPKAEATAIETGRITDKLRNHKGMSDVIGIPDNPLVLKGLVPGTEAADFRTLLNQITGRTFMEIFPTLKGGGQITEIEGEKGQAAINRMSTSMSEKAFLEALDDFDNEIDRLKKVIRTRAGKPTGLPPGFVED